MTIRFRATFESDAEALSHMMIASWRNTYATILSSTKLDEICTVWLTPEKFLQRARKTDAVNFVALHEEKIVGHIFAKFSQIGSLHIVYLYVAKGFLRQGIGERLLKYAIDKAEKAKSITLGVFSDNLAAFDFYTAQGFKVVGEDNAKDWQCGDPTGVKMERLL